MNEEGKGKRIDMERDREEKGIGEGGKKGIRVEERG